MSIKIIRQNAEYINGDYMNEIRPAKRCSYLKYCYLADVANCFGYKTDCPLYMVTNDEFVSENSFHKAMDELINKTKIEFEGFPGAKPNSGI